MNSPGSSLPGSNPPGSNQSTPGLPAPTASLDVALAHASRLLDTDPALAGEQAREILRVVPDHPMATLVLGVSHRTLGDARRAVEILAPLARAHADWASVHCELGLALGRAGRGADAVAALRRAVALKPDLPQAWRALGDHLPAATRNCSPRPPRCTTTAFRKPKPCCASS
jgi:predicted Zn-dependent protease